nr:ABC transporter ATP-binding protein [Microbacterium immunditiarum]
MVLVSAHLEVKAVSLHFGGLQVLSGLSFSVQPGTVCALIGPNGAGKTSLFNCISRLYRPSNGAITINAIDVLAVRAHDAVRIGIARTFQNLALFGTLTVRENVLAGAHGATSSGMVADLLRLPRARREMQATRAKADAVIDEIGLTHVAETTVSSLPFGTQKRVELARALMSDPQLLMLDEPANGLDHSEVEELAQLVRDIAERRDLTVLLVEHHIGMVMTVADHVVVLDAGRKVAEGDPQSVVNNPDVIRAYLGKAA